MKLHREISILQMMLSCAVAITLFHVPSIAHAINFAAGAKVAPGYILNLYPYYYRADKLTDKDGNTAADNLGLRKQGLYLGNSYYVGDLFFNALIPLGKLDVDLLQASDSGLGDVQLRAGWFPPVKWVTILPALMVKIPSGNFDKTSRVNFGDGQADLAVELFVHKIAEPFSFDCLLKYTVRFRNPDIDSTPGNEFAAEGLATWKLADKIRLGPALNLVVGEDMKKAGVTRPDSGLMRLSLGGEIYYGRIASAKISLAAYREIITRNTNEGTTFLSRIVIPF